MAHTTNIPKKQARKPIRFRADFAQTMIENHNRIVEESKSVDWNTLYEEAKKKGDTI